MHGNTQAEKHTHTQTRLNTSTLKLLTGMIRLIKTPNHTLVQYQLLPHPSIELTRLRPHWYSG